MYFLLNECYSIEKQHPGFSTFFTKAKYGGISFDTNMSGANILRLCNGQRTISNIVNSLAAKYGESVQEVKEEVEEFLESAMKHDYVKIINEPNSLLFSLVTVGSYDFWFPEDISIELTRKCHLKCKHCYLDAGTGKDMDLEILKSIINELSHFHVRHVQITGGEAILHSSFFQIVDLFVSAEIPITITTSGAFSDSNLLRKFAKYKNCDIRFQVSLDGLEEYHDEFRGVRGCYSETIEFIKCMISYNFNMTVAFTYNDQKTTEIIQLCKQCRDLGVAIFRLGIFSQRGRALDNITENHQRGKQVKELHQKLTDLFASNSFHILFADAGLEDVLREGINCGFGHQILHISYDGSVYPCMMSEVNIGSLVDNSIIEILSQHSRFFENLSAPCKQVCSDCEYSSLCNVCICDALHYCKESDTCAWQIKNRIDIMKLLNMSNLR